MRSLIFAVFFVAALLSASSIAFAQGAEPTPQPTPQLTPQLTPAPTPSTAASSQPTTPPEYMRAWPEPGRHHPCPASVGLANGRTVCLGWDDGRRRSRTRHVARPVQSGAGAAGAAGSFYPGRFLVRCVSLRGEAQPVRGGQAPKESSRAYLRLPHLAARRPGASIPLAQSQLALSQKLRQLCHVPRYMLRLLARE